MKAAGFILAFPVILILAVVMLVAVPRDEWNKLNDSLE